MEWNDEMILEFLNNYEAEPIIWDPKNLNHKKKHLVADAWRRLKSNLSYGDSTSVEELKKKKDSLMAYYRIHLNKIKNSKKSGMGTEESYKTNWFAFSTMNSFLAPIYECSPTINTEDLTEKADIAESSSSTQTVDSTPIKKKRQNVMPDLLQAKKQMDEAYSILKERETNKKERVHECDLYAQLLAEKLKKIDEERRITLMHDIDNLVYQEIMYAKTQERAASVASSYTSSSQSNHDMVLPQSPFIIRPPSPNRQTEQSTQSVALLSSDHEVVILQSQQPFFQQLHPSPQIQSLPSNLISMQSQPLYKSQIGQKKINIVSQKIINPGKDILSEAYYNIIDTIDSEQE